MGNNEINTNSIDEMIIRDSSLQKETIGCEMCEFAMAIVDKHLTDSATIDQVERIVQFMCSYLPGTIADKCEEFVDQYGQKIIDAVVNDSCSQVRCVDKLSPSVRTRGQLPAMSTARNVFGDRVTGAPPHSMPCRVELQKCARKLFGKLSLLEL